MDKNENKALQYDQIIREADILNREISQLKAKYPINTPILIEEQIEHKKDRLDVLERHLKGLFKK